METIKLCHHTWEVDLTQPIGSPGGFGEIFLGHGESGRVAIKRLKVNAADAAHRELQIGQALSQRSLTHIVQILDYGQDAESDRYYIVMPICERSLQDVINSGHVFTTAERIDTLLAILYGLKEAKDIVHRDLKPSNILLHEGRWKVADFGIAKFVEDSTSLETLRSSLTPSYAAPEQWLLRRPTHATDIYAVGCIAHALATGLPPFQGDMDTLREHHLGETPQALKNLPASVRSLVSQMIRKGPELRPSLERCVAVLERVQAAEPERAGGSDKRISEAVSALAVAQARDEAANEARAERKRSRRAITDEAVRDLTRIRDRLFAEISRHAHGVIDKSSNDSFLCIGQAKLAFSTSEHSSRYKGLRRSDPEEFSGESSWGVHKPHSTWDIVAFTQIMVEQQVKHEFYRRCANIVFGRPSENSDYRWYEMAFWSLSSSRPRAPASYPFCLDYPWEIDEALSNALTINDCAYKPVPIDAEDEDSFIEHWIDVVASAMVGQLKKPSGMPMNR